MSVQDQIEELRERAAARIDGNTGRKRTSTLSPFPDQVVARYVWMRNGDAGQEEGNLEEVLQLSAASFKRFVQPRLRGKLTWTQYKERHPKGVFYCMVRTGHEQPADLPNPFLHRVGAVNDLLDIGAGAEFWCLEVWDFDNEEAVAWRRFDDAAVRSVYVHDPGRYKVEGVFEGDITPVDDGGGDDDDDELLERRAEKEAPPARKGPAKWVTPRLGPAERAPGPLPRPPRKTWEAPTLGPGLKPGTGIPRGQRVYGPPRLYREEQLPGPLPRPAGYEPPPARAPYERPALGPARQVEALLAPELQKKHVGERIERWLLGGSLAVEHDDKMLNQYFRGKDFFPPGVTPPKKKPKGRAQQEEWIRRKILQLAKGDKWHYRIPKTNLRWWDLKSWLKGYLSLLPPKRKRAPTKDQVHEIFWSLSCHPWILQLERNRKLLREASSAFKAWAAVPTISPVDRGAAGRFRERLEERIRELVPKPKPPKEKPAWIRRRATPDPAAPAPADPVAPPPPMYPPRVGPPESQAPAGREFPEILNQGLAAARRDGIRETMDVWWSLGDRPREAFKRWLEHVDHWIRHDPNLTWQDTFRLVVTQVLLNDYPTEAREMGLDDSELQAAFSRRKTEKGPPPRPPGPPPPGAPPPREDEYAPGAAEEEWDWEPCEDIDPDTLQTWMTDESGNVVWPQNLEDTADHLRWIEESYSEKEAEMASTQDEMADAERLGENDRYAEAQMEYEEHAAALTALDDLMQALGDQVAEMRRLNGIPPEAGEEHDEAHRQDLVGEAYGRAGEQDKARREEDAARRRAATPWTWDEAIERATRTMAGSDRRRAWLQQRGATDAEIKAWLGFEFGTSGGHSTPDRIGGLEYGGGKNPRLGIYGDDGRSPAEEMKGKVLVELARHVLRIPQVINPGAPVMVPEDWSPDEPAAPSPTAGRFRRAHKGERVWLQSHPQGVRYPGFWLIVDLGRVVASHWADLNAQEMHTDDRYPVALQPRDRSRRASFLQVTELAESLQPDLLGPSALSADGAPTVYESADQKWLWVVCGNARIAALRLLYEDEELWVMRDAYFSWLINSLEHLGFVADDIEADLSRMDAPVLVRAFEEALTESELEKFADMCNSPAVAERSGTELAVRDASLMTPKVMRNYQPTDTGEILHEGNRAFVADFFDQVIPSAERNRYQDPKGHISQDGARRIQNAVMAYGYGGSPVVFRFAEMRDSNVRNVTNALLMVAGLFGELRRGADEGYLYDLTIGDDLVAATEKLATLRKQGMAVHTYLEQTELFSRELSPVARLALEIFDHFARSARRIAEVLRLYAEAAVGMGHPAQKQLFVAKEPSPRLTLLQDAARKVYAEDRAGDQPSLLEAGQNPHPGEAVLLDWKTKGE